MPPAPPLGVPAAPGLPSTPSLSFSCLLSELVTQSGSRGSNCDLHVPAFELARGRGEVSTACTATTSDPPPRTPHRATVVMEYSVRDGQWRGAETWPGPQWTCRWGKSNSPALCCPPGAGWGCADGGTWAKASVLCAGAFLGDTSPQVSERGGEEACVTAGAQRALRDCNSHRARRPDVDRLIRVLHVLLSQFVQVVFVSLGTRAQLSAPLPAVLWVPSPGDGTRGPQSQQLGSCPGALSVNCPVTAAAAAASLCLLSGVGNAPGGGQWQRRAVKVTVLRNSLEARCRRKPQP